MYPKALKSVSRRDICPPLFIAALFPIAKTWKQPESINRWVNKEKVVYIYKEILFNRGKGGNPDICDNIYIWVLYAKWTKADKDKTWMISLTCWIWKAELIKTVDGGYQVLGVEKLKSRFLRVETYN